MPLKLLFTFSFILAIRFNGLCQLITPGDTALCFGGSVELRATGAPTGATFQWLKDGTPIKPAATFISYLATSTGSYSVIVTAGGSEALYPPVAVTVYGRIDAGFTSSQTRVCSGTAVLFTATTTNGNPPFTYYWKFGDGKLDTTLTDTVTHIFNLLGCDSGTVTNSLIVKDSHGCTSANYSAAIKVLRAPDVQLSDSNTFAPFNNCGNNPSAAKPEYTITVNNISPNAACINSYSIDWGDGNSQENISANDFPLTHTYKSLGQFNLVVTGFGKNGCSNSRTYGVANQRSPDGGFGTVEGTLGCARY